MKKTDFLVPYWNFEEEKNKLTIVKGRTLVIEGVFCYVHLAFDRENFWKVSHYESGFEISSDLNRKYAIANAGEKIRKRPDINEVAKKQTRRAGFVYPVNQIPKKYVRN